MWLPFTTAMRTARRLLALALLTGLAVAPGSAAEQQGNGADRYGSPRTGFDYYPPVSYGALSLVTPPAAKNSERQPAAWSNGDSRHPAFSQDNRDARYMAFDSTATNLVHGDHNGVRDVFVMRRTRGGGNMTGRLFRASVSTRGAEANGPSESPSVDGETHSRPHCVAFTSAATNLDARDRSPDTDIYLRDLARKTTRLISRGANIAATAPVVDGRCESVTFEAGGSIYVASVHSGRVFFLTRGQDSDQQTNGEGVAYVRGNQVRYRSFRLSADGRHLHRGHEQLASTNTRGRPGNGASYHPALDDVGNYVAFQSNATDLCGARRCKGIQGDPTGPLPDIYRRTLSRHAPTHDSMEMMASYTRGDPSSAYQLPAARPAISAAGENIVFTALFNAVAYMTPGWSQIRIPAAELVSWEFPRKRGYGTAKLMSRDGCDPSRCVDQISEVAMSARGNYVAFATTRPEFCAPRRPRGYAGDRDCNQNNDIFMRFMGWSHEGYPLG